MAPYIDIHTHSFYQSDNTRLLLNVFPEEIQKLKHKCFFSMGLHPWYVKTSTVDQNLEWIEKQAYDHRVLAIGEIGFDKTIDVPWAEQEHAFTRQLTLAEKLNKPVILHCVRSYNELILYRNKSNKKLPWIFHWFNASLEIAHELIRKNCYLSFGHMLFNEKSKIFRIFPEIPDECIFLETDDAGFSIEEISEHAARLKGIPLNQLLKQINNNFIRCFGNL
ncbi:MAG: TatD family hydrolase [Bacteroidales bacterium]|nr:TatD family hydrolase [Bacteroidales bacterium]